jgi:ribosomal-protein-alanine N-acetyltransferase
MSPTLPYRVDDMTVADLERVMEIEARTYTSPWPESAYRYELENNELAHYLVVLPNETVANTPPTLRQRIRNWVRNPRQGRPVLGYAGFFVVAVEAHVSTIAVDPDWRGFGLGELLLIKMLEHAIERSAILMTLEVRVSNEAAQKLYEKYQFDYVGRRKRYYQNNNEDAHIMTVEGILTEAYRALLDAQWTKLETRMRPTDGDLPPSA